MGDGVTIAADWVHPVDAPSFGPGWLRIEDGLIVEVAAGEAPEGAIDGKGAMLLPGFVNAHAHLACHLLKGRMVRGAFGEWIGEAVTPPLMDIIRSGDREPFRAAADAACAELLAGGVTTVADGFLDDAGREAMRDAGLAGVYYREIFGVSAADEAAYIDEMRGRIDEDRRRATESLAYGLAPHAPYTCPHETLEAMAEIAREADLPLSVHVAESPEEDDFFRRDSGPMRRAYGRENPDRFRRQRSPLAAVDAAGALGSRTLVVHAVQLDEDDLELLATRTARVVHCPGSNFRLGVGIAPVAAMRSRGIPVALGTDSGASNGKLDMFEEMRLAAHGQALLARRAGILDAKTLVEMATLEGARVLDRDERTGSLTPGKIADLQLVRLDGVRHRPFADPLEALVFASTPDDVIGVWAAGIRRKESR